MIHYWLVLLTIAVAVAYIADKIKQPYPTLLVIAGLLLGVIPIPALDEIKTYVASDHVFQTAVILIFLSALIGDAALKLHVQELKANKRPILLLSLLGTFITFVLIAGLCNALLGLSLQKSLVFGALMAATDPVSVLSIFKSMGLNEKLSTIVEGESLANDGVAVVLFKIAAVTTVLSASGTLEGAVEFVKVVLGGMIIGVVGGFIASRITSKIDNYLVEIGLSIVLFYGVFEMAEMFHLSGVISVVFAGLLLGTYGKKIGMSDFTLEKMDSFWEVIAFIANALIFLMVGLEISNIDFTDKWLEIGGSILIVVAARFIAVYVSLLRDRSIPSAWKPIIAWGGLKGSLSIALILSISPSFEGRDLLLAMTFSNVVFSLLIQGTTVSKLVSKLKVS
ncbi:CPA1 family monovalent cation:H+ antiporter [Paenibacillus sp. V4I3]|uniref:cation:proton antiporter n=1 Tax=unclassified Paenibacillus TaxID=185978 RepID=UPI002784B615|nr:MULTISPECIES: cation:proton antiporter [unclassified Paenibacillus]MDQ0872732.1 CPA1 family monovalent cation:H+ antiporter [Paenibacillus sp. V4I3]MDQ0891353.1 CPA1 family monovalent cation:H+ antiporter [Paenibacillus sp. V4I9]